MIWVIGLLIGIFVLDGLRMRARLSRLGTIPVATDPDEPTGHFITAPGVHLDDTARLSASAYARERGLDVLDLVPGDLPTTRALALAQLTDTGAYRANRLAAGRTASHALLVSADVVKRARPRPEDAADPVAFARLAARLKRYACTTMDLAVLPDARAVAEDVDKRLAVTREVIGGATPFVLAVQLIVFAGLVAGLVVPETRLWGAVALGVFHLQPVLALAGTPVHSRDLLWVTLFRLPYELYSWVRTLTGRWRPDDGPDPVAVRRPVYSELLAGESQRFFEGRRETCPVCQSQTLGVHLQTTDLLQQKPGKFVLEKCGDCGHIFQNPRLSIEGLDFYYKDFYDGLGEKGMEFIFGYSPVSYLGRARMLTDRGAPSNWLDVGGGHGHFCCIARDVWPDTQFDGLDMSESIDEAVRRGWVDKGYRGLFPEVAPTMRGKYDVVSMHHYLEHTRDPEEEIEAAHTALADGGHLLIEVPDPESFLGKLLRRYWIPWFQPQHQHLLSRGNLDRLLHKHGFHAVEWHRAEAHQKVDFLFAVFLFLDRLAPPTDRPWKTSASFGKKAWRGVVWTLGSPLVLLARGADVAFDPLVRKMGMSNTYRVLARRTA